MMSEKYIDDVVHIQMSTPRIDSRNAHEFKHEIYKLIDSGQKNLLISLRSVEFIDSSGLGAIVSSLVSMGRRGEIVLCVGIEGGQVVAHADLGREEDLFLVEVFVAFEELGGVLSEELHR